MAPRRPGWNPQLLRDHRHAHHITLEQAAEKIRVLRLPDGSPAPAATFQMIGEHERGTSYPGPRYRQAYTQLYNTTQAALGFGDTTVTANPVAAQRTVSHHGRAQPANVGLEQLWTHDGLTAALEGVTTVPGTPLERRQFLTLSGAALATVAHEWLIADPARIAAALTGRRADAEVVADLTTTVNALRRLDDKLGGQAVHGMVIEQLRLVVGLLRNASYTETDGRGLYAVAAELAQLAGWASYDAGAYGTAQRYYLVGLRAATEADAPGVGANILRCMATTQEYGLDDPRSAVDLLRSARAGTRGRLTATEQAVLAGQLAVSHSRAGDRRAASAAADDALRHIAQAQPSEDPPYVYWVAPHWITYFAGSSLIFSGEPRAAVAHLQSAVDTAADDGQPVRDLATYRARLATAHARAGDADAAAALTQKIIDDVASGISARSHKRITDVCQELDSAGHPAATDLAEQARSLLASRDI